MKRLACLLVFALAAPAWGQSVKLPAEVRGIPGEWIVIPATVDGGPPRWRFGPGLAEVDLSVLLPDYDPKKARGRVVKASAAGRYLAEAWNAKGDAASDIAACIVVIGDAPPPGPTPPPPGPTPPDPLTGPLQVAYDRAKDPTALVDLGQFYLRAQSLVADAPTWGAFYAQLQAAAVAGRVAGKLPGVQSVMASELFAKTLPDATDPQVAARVVSYADRELVVKTFQRARAALAGVKP